VSAIPVAAYLPNLQSERQITKAQSRGDFGDTPGAWAPLALEDGAQIT